VGALETNFDLLLTKRKEVSWVIKAANKKLK
jgi:hypothetical protein